MIVKVFDYYYYINKDSEDAEYNAPILVLKTREKNGTLHLIQICDKEKLAPRFGVLAHDFENFIEDYIDSTEAGYILRWEDAPDSIYKEKITRIYVTFPWHVNRLKDMKNEFDGQVFRQTFQADIKWEKMAMSNIITMLGLEGPFIEIEEDDYKFSFLKIEDLGKVSKEDFFFLLGRTCYWDIESDARDLPRRIEYEDLPKMPILSIACCDSYTEDYTVFTWHPNFEENKKLFLREYEIIDNVNIEMIDVGNVTRYECTTEEEMLKKFFEYFGNYKFDHMFGYFSVGGWDKRGGVRKWVDGFDMPCLYQRSKKLGLLREMQKMSTSPKKTGYRDRYDAVKMRSYMGKHQVNIKGMSQIDFVFSAKTLGFAQRYYKFRGYKLEHWAEFFLDYHKLDKKGKHVWEYWVQNDFDFDEPESEPYLFRNNGLIRVPNKGLEFMLDYNIIDTKICLDLDKRFNVTKTQSGRGEVSISPASDGLEASKLHDHFKLTHFQDQYSFDTKYQRYKRTPLNGKDQIGDNFTISLELMQEKARAGGKNVNYNSLKDVGKAGGFVPVPTRGIYEDIAVIDASKFYPNMIKSTNAGIISLVDVAKIGWCAVIDKHGTVYDRKDLIETPVAFFRKDVKSINALVFDRWMIERETAQGYLKEYTDEFKTTKTDRYKTLWSEQFNIKNFMNAGFGILGLHIDRTYSVLVFNSCTVSCQDNILKCMEILRDFRVKIIGGDTDSMFIKLITKGKKNQIKEANRICKWLDRCISWYLDKVYNIQKHTIHIGLETISDKFFVDTMKHYVKRNWYAEDVELEKLEVEIKGMDLKKRATSVIGSELQTKLFEITFETEDPEYEIERFIFDFDSKLETRSWTEVCKHGPVNKHLDEYPSSNESAKAALNALKYLDRYYEPGSNPFLGVFKKYPSKLNGKFITNNGDFKMSFEKEDEKFLRSKGFVINYDKIRDSECHKKTSGFLSMFSTDYQTVKERAETGDSLAI